MNELTVDLRDNQVIIQVPRNWLSRGLDHLPPDQQQALVDKFKGLVTKSLGPAGGGREG